MDSFLPVAILFTDYLHGTVPGDSVRLSGPTRGSPEIAFSRRLTWSVRAFLFGLQRIGGGEFGVCSS